MGIKMLVASLLLTLSMPIVLAIDDAQTQIVNEIKDETIKYETTPLEKWVDNLGKHENCPTTGMVDSNGLKSYGRFCYQADTFIGFVRDFQKKYEILPYTEDGEIMNWISDDVFTKQLTIMIIQDNYNNHNHWKNTVKKIGLPPK